MKTKTWKILLACLILALLFLVHVVFLNNDKLPEQIISQHIDYQLNQNSRLVLTYYNPPYSGVYTEIHISDSNWLSHSIKYDSGMFMKRGINGNISDQEMDNLLVKLLQIDNNSWEIESYLANRGEVLIMSVKIPSSDDTQKYSVVTCNGNGCPKELCVLFDLVQTVAKREGKAYSQRTPIPCSVK